MNVVLGNTKGRHSKSWRSRSLLVGMLTLAAACGDDDARESDSSTHTVSLGPDCKSVRAPTILVDQISANDFELSGDELFFVDPAARALKKHSVKGGAGTTLVAFEPSQRVGEDVLVDGDDVFFRLGTQQDDAKNLPIYRVSRAGGTPSKLPAETSDVATGIWMIAADAASIFTTDYATFITRVSKATGAAEYVIKDYPKLTTPQLYEGKIYFSDMTTGDIMSIDKGASNGKPELVLKGACDRLYDISVSSSRISCGLDVYNWQGGKTNFLDNAGRLAPPQNGGLFSYSGADHTLSQVAFDPLKVQLLACDVYSDMSVIRASDTDVYWLNVRTVDKRQVRSINRTPRR